MGVLVDEKGRMDRKHCQEEYGEGREGVIEKYIEKRIKNYLEYNMRKVYKYIDRKLLEKKEDKKCVKKKVNLAMERLTDYMVEFPGYVAGPSDTGGMGVTTALCYEILWMDMGSWFERPSPYFHLEKYRGEDKMYVIFRVIDRNGGEGKSYNLEKILTAYEKRIGRMFLRKLKKRYNFTSKLSLSLLSTRREIDL